MESTHDGRTLQWNVDAQEQWRNEWAEYFEARAAKSEKMADLYPDCRDEWTNKAHGEAECAFMLRSGKSLDELLAALK